MFLYVDPQPVSFTLALGHKHILRASADVHALENVYYPYIIGHCILKEDIVNIEDNCLFRCKIYFLRVICSRVKRGE